MEQVLYILVPGTKVLKTINIDKMKQNVKGYIPHLQGSFAQKVDSAIHRTNLYPLDSAIVSPSIYPLDSDYPVDNTIQLLSNWGLFFNIENAIHYGGQNEKGVG